jgi:uncharacterized Tic20 family protein
MEALTKDQKNFAMFCHLIAFVGLIIPFGFIIGPLVLWLMKREESEFIDHHGKESLNFQISFVIYGIIAAILTLVLIGIVLAIILGILWLVFIIVAAIKASNGEMYRYPFTIRFVK